MPMTELRGVLTAMATPFDEAGAVDEAAARDARPLPGRERLARPGRRRHDRRVDDPRRRGAHRRCCARSSTRSATRRLIVCGTGTNDTRHSIELTKAAAEAGADAALVVTPYYNKPNPAGILAHFEAIAAAVPDLPLIAYNIPSRVIVNVSPAELAELAKIDNVVAVKQANNDELGPIDGHGGAGRQRRHLPAHPRTRRSPAASSSPRTWSARRCGRSGTRSRPATSSGRARSTPSLRPLYEALGVTTNPMPVKAALEMTGTIPSGTHAAADGRARRRPARASCRAALESVGLTVDGGLVARPKKLRILPLGGLGEIGKNMTVVEYDGRIVVVDTGLMFPTAEMLGIDLVLPDFSYLRDRADDIEAIVLTHGHEDHVGALPYVLREIGKPPVIYGGLLTIGMVRSKLDEHKLADAPLQELPAGEKVKAGPFELELIHLSHSIPDMRGGAADHRARLGADDRRLQVRPDPGRRPAGRHVAARRARPRGPAAALRRLDQRRPARHGALGVERRPGPAGDLLATARGGSSSPPSPPTSTASSR